MKDYWLHMVMFNYCHTKFLMWNTPCMQDLH
jgi:hypothetical protein